MNGPQPKADRDAADAERRAEAARILNRVDGEGEVFASSGLSGLARRGRDHLAATELGDRDQVELWATRIGRGLGLIAVIGLAAWLIYAYLL